MSVSFKIDLEQDSDEELFIVPTGVDEETSSSDDFIEEEIETTYNKIYKSLSDKYSDQDQSEEISEDFTDINPNVNLRTDEDLYLISYNKYANDFMDSIKREPILEEENERFTILPIDNRYKKIWDNYKIQQANYWVAEEVDLSKDLVDWEKLGDDERFFIESILAFFAASDGIVNLNLTKRFSNDIKIKEAQCAYDFQKQIENIHGEMYSLLLESYIKDETKKTKLINSFQTIPCIKRKGEWALKWIDSDKTFAHRVVAFAVVEGIFFSGSFASIFWLKNRSIMPGLIQSNKFISRDEGLHTDFACLLFEYLVNRLKQSVVYEIVKEAVNIEKEFINDSLPCRLLGINSTLMSQYIEYVADRLLVQLNYNKLYNATNPLDYMETINMENKDNFFEKRPTEYSNSKINNNQVFKILSDGF
jgi:ribonucleoside-diphosphate reductase subunit M2